MHSNPSATPAPLRVRRAVPVVAAAALAGFLAIDGLGRVVLPGQQYSGAAPLRVAATKESGRVGGLLPAVRLRTRSGSMPARDLRPAVVLLVRFPCECLARLAHLTAQADGSKVHVYVVGSTGRPQVDRLAEAVGRGVVPLVDVGHRLDRAYRLTEDAMLLLVRRDGVVTEIFDEVPPNMDLGSHLPALLDVP